MAERLHVELETQAPNTQKATHNIVFFVGWAGGQGVCATHRLHMHRQAWRHSQNCAYDPININYIMT